MRSCQYIANIALVAYGTDALEANFDAGVDFYLCVGSAPLFCPETCFIFNFSISWMVGPEGVVS